MILIWCYWIIYEMKLLKHGWWNDGFKILIYLFATRVRIVLQCSLSKEVLTGWHPRYLTLSLFLESFKISCFHLLLTFHLALFFPINYSDWILMLSIISGCNELKWVQPRRWHMELRMYNTWNGHIKTTLGSVRGGEIFVLLWVYLIRNLF